MLEELQTANCNKELKVLPTTIRTPYVDFRVLDCSSEVGFAGIIGTGMFSIPEPDLIRKLTSDVATKAKK